LISLVGILPILLRNNIYHTNIYFVNIYQIHYFFLGYQSPYYYTRNRSTHSSYTFRRSPSLKSSDLDDDDCNVYDDYEDYINAHNEYNEFNGFDYYEMWILILRLIDNNLYYNK